MWIQAVILLRLNWFIDKVLHCVWIPWWKPCSQFQHVRMCVFLSVRACLSSAQSAHVYTGTHFRNWSWNLIRADHLNRTHMCYSVRIVLFKCRLHAHMTKYKLCSWSMVSCIHWQVLCGRVRVCKYLCVVLCVTLCVCILLTPTYTDIWQTCTVEMYADLDIQLW